MSLTSLGIATGGLLDGGGKPVLHLAVGGFIRLGGGGGAFIGCPIIGYPAPIMALYGLPASVQDIVGAINPPANVTGAPAFLTLVSDQAAVYSVTGRPSPVRVVDAANPFLELAGCPASLGLFGWPISVTITGNPSALNITGDPARLLNLHGVPNGQC